VSSCGILGRSARIYQRETFRSEISKSLLILEAFVIETDFLKLLEFFKSSFFFASKLVEYRGNNRTSSIGRRLLFQRKILLLLKVRDLYLGRVGISLELIC
jgi:hypothetical protein